MCEKDTPKKLLGLEMEKCQKYRCDLKPELQRERKIRATALINAKFQTDVENRSY